MESTVTGKELTVTLFWQHNNSTDKETVTGITYGNVTETSGNNLKIRDKITGLNPYQMKFKITDVNQPSYVSITITELPPAKIVIPGVPKENLASNYPVGTIIASVLDFKRFCKLNGQADVINYADQANCKWVPADGRSVLGSAYGTVENNVPDLRGVFLRAVNDFGVSGVQYVNAAQAETDVNGTLVNRVANNFEGDDFRSHSHQVPGGAAVNPSGGWALENVGRSGTLATSSSGGNETRPKNITVYYYVKIS